MSWKKILIVSIGLLINREFCSAAATNEPSSLNKLDAAASGNTIQKNSQDVFSTRSLAKECDSSYSISCFKLDVLSFVEKMSENPDYNILPGLSLVKETTGNEAKTAEVVSQLARSFPNDPDKRLDNFLMYKINNYFNTHALRLKLIDNGKGDLGEARKGGGGGGGFGGSGFGGSGGGGGKKGGGGGGLLAAALMMKGTLAALGLGAIAALAGKALMTALMALMLSAIIGIKSLSHGGHKSTTYEIVTKPVYSHSNTHSSSHEDVHHGYGHSGYGRSLNLELPKHLQKPEQ